MCSYNPAKVRGVEVTHARRFLAYSIDQPHMLLHELAHGFHGRVLGWDNEEVLQCYEVRLVLVALLDSRLRHTSWLAGSGCVREV